MQETQKMISRFSLNTAKVLVLLLVVLCLLSCSVTDNHVVKYDSFPKQYLLSADSVPTQALYDNVFMTIVNGTVVVSSSKADTLMHFYSTPALDYLFGTGVRGHSSHEMQSLPTFCQSMNGDLYVRGFTPYSLRRFRISQDRLLEKGRYNLHFYESPNDMHLIHDSLFYYNDLTNMEVNSYNLNRGKMENRFQLSSMYDCGKDALIGIFCVNDSLAIYAFQYKKEILVLRTKDLSYVKTVTWDYDNQDDIIGTPQYLSAKLFYTAGMATRNYFYLLYRGSIPYDKKAQFSIDVYDRNAVPVCKYNLDRKIFKFVMDEKNGYIYGFGENGDYIYRYKVNPPH